MSSSSPFDRDKDVDSSGSPVQMELTSEEKQVLKDFRTESFWYRCVPFTAFNCVLVHLLARQGYLKYNPRYGHIHGYAAAIGIGYIGGKLLAFPEFQRRLLELREGRLADELGQTEHASSVPPDQSLTPSYRPFDANLQTSQKKPKRNQYGDIIEQ